MNWKDKLARKAAPLWLIVIAAAVVMAVAMPLGMAIKADNMNRAPMVAGH